MCLLACQKNIMGIPTILYKKRESSSSVMSYINLEMKEALSMSICGRHL
jgi:hypothetical protein